MQEREKEKVCYRRCSTFASVSRITQLDRRITNTQDIMHERSSWRFPDVDDLVALAVKHKTDKEGPHSYCAHYEHHLKHLRARPIRLLEIGVGGYKNPTSGGASLRMWKEYFPLATIVGVDIVDKTALAEDRIHIVQGDQGNPRFLQELGSSLGPFDVIIDDGSHHATDVLCSLRHLFPFVRGEEGLYVVEDLQTGYWPQFGGSSSDRANEESPIGFLKGLLDAINHQELLVPGYVPSYFDQHVVALHFYHNLAFICKGRNNERSNVLKNNDAPGTLLDRLARMLD